MTTKPESAPPRLHHVSAEGPGTDAEWDRYVESAEGASCFHLSAWLRAVERAYRYPAIRLVARDGNGTIRGVLPAVRMKGLLSGSPIVSVPFADLGGILAENAETRDALRSAALELARRSGAGPIEARGESVRGIPPGSASVGGTDKAILVRVLPSDSDELFREFKPKLRSQIRKPEKEGLTFQNGGVDLLDDFYRVFCENMRDLGSPVHSRRWFESVASEFGDRCRIGAVYRGDVPVAAGVTLACAGTVFIPWASSLRRYNDLSPNMMLYWNFLRHACESGFRRFNFGRSSPGSGTYRFKEQWGAVPEPLRWFPIGPGREATGRPASRPAKDAARGAAARIWSMFPLPLANVLGPPLRRRIPL